MSSIYLCGFMGCGKSHIGRMLARFTDRKLVDLDAVIVEREGMSIPDIFAQYGEPHFRELEAKYIRELSDGYIVATGGGALINDSGVTLDKAGSFQLFHSLDHRGYRKIHLRADLGCVHSGILCQASDDSNIDFVHTHHLCISFIAL
jgi:shikimate kinase